MFTHSFCMWPYLHNCRWLEIYCVNYWTAPVFIMFAYFALDWCQRCNICRPWHANCKCVLVTVRSLMNVCKKFYHLCTSQAFSLEDLTETNVGCNPPFHIGHEESMCFPHTSHNCLQTQILASIWSELWGFPPAPGRLWGRVGMQNATK